MVVNRSKRIYYHLLSDLQYSGKNANFATPKHRGLSTDYAMADPERPRGYR